ncbi:phospho-sugar mutase [Lewinella cohaerens]|uniref:phospho-sugar mutase n=1 Tax=Lewinella cohaerens TaxID=70995 RepID=UPI00037CE897|nr:phospho-sugar mutase [Lewinella cohaerens]
MSLVSLDSSVQANINQWLNGNYDEESKQYIRQLIEEEKHTELTDSFYKDLEFGTGGIRGIMGVGSNRINKYTLGMATQGLSNYLLQLYPDQEIKVAIAHDCRNDSDTFARLVAEVFSANGIYVYFFNGLRPTPELSFAIRELGCKSGVMITASHNPKEYNGYKAYGDDGGQLTAPHDVNVMAEVDKINSVDEIKFTPQEDKIETIGKEMDEQYLAALLKLSISRDAIKRQHDLPIVFSPIHGTGGVMVPPALEQFGFTNVHLVKEQMVVDGNFPTVIYPNPEEKEALTMAMDQAKAKGAELVMATDPDADRVGIAVRNNDGEFILLNGNQTAALLINYVMTAWEKSGKLTGKEYVIKTIVTSYLIDKMAESKGIECFNTLTGFKWIGKIMTELEGKKTFLAGGEESYGLLVGEHARDKDAVISCAMIAEMAAFYKDQGRSIYDALLDIYVEYGCYKEKLIAITKKGKSGAEEIAALMDKYRKDPPLVLGGSQVTTIMDYASSTAHHVADGSTAPIDLPSSNVLQFFTEDGSIISARPSGTEPKIKFYCSVNAPLNDKIQFPTVEQTLDTKLDNIMKDLGV